MCSGEGLLASPLNEVLGAHRDTILKSSRKSIGPAITALAESGLKSAEVTLEIWRDKDMWYRASDDKFYRVEDDDVFDLASLSSVLVGSRRRRGLHVYADTDVGGRLQTPQVHL